MDLNGGERRQCPKCESENLRYRKTMKLAYVCGRCGTEFRDPDKAEGVAPDAKGGAAGCGGSLLLLVFVFAVVAAFWGKCASRSSTETTAGVETQASAQSADAGAKKAAGPTPKKPTAPTKPKAPPAAKSGEPGEAED